MCGGVFTCRVMAIFLPKINRKNRKRHKNGHRNKRRRMTRSLFGHHGWRALTNFSFSFLLGYEYDMSKSLATVYSSSGIIILGWGKIMTIPTSNFFFNQKWGDTNVTIDRAEREFQKNFSNTVMLANKFWKKNKTKYFKPTSSSWYLLWFFVKNSMCLSFRLAWK